MFSGAALCAADFTSIDRHQAATFCCALSGAIPADKDDGEGHGGVWGGGQLQVTYITSSLPHAHTGSADRSVCHASEKIKVVNRGQERP